ERFVNYYQVLGVPPDANTEIIERKFRSLVRRFHPDNLASGDRGRFEAILEAHNTLKDPLKRDRYNTLYQEELGSCPPSGEEAGQGATADGVETDSDDDAPSDTVD